MFLRSAFCALAAGLFAFSASATEFNKHLHALPLYGEAKYPADFKHFEYVNPDAPKGGEIKLSSTTSFDNLNPFILKGVKAAGIGMIFESLMTSSLDEPATLYGLIAESVTVGEDYGTAEFALRPEAKWHDGTAITADDIVFSFETLMSKGDPGWKVLFAGIGKVEKTAENKVRFTFKEKGNRELPQISATMPVVSKAYYTANEFDKTTLTSPLGSGPYKVSKVDQGRSITYERVKDYWGKDLPVNIGQNNFDVVKYLVYTDETVSLEALKAGEFDYREEYIARNWATAYKSPAIDKGDLIKREVKHNNPAGIQAFAFNVRKSKFADRRVREAIALTLDYEWVNKTIFYSAYTRSASYFENTQFAAHDKPTEAEIALLKPFEKDLPPEVFTTPFYPPKTDGTGNAREQLLKAQKLLNEAGWVMKDGKRVNEKTGEVLTMEFLLHQQTMERVAAPMRKNLKKLGIEAPIRYVDASQYQKRLEEWDFDMISIWLNRGVHFPGNEQIGQWGSAQADIKGSNNIIGIKNPAADALMQKLITAKNMEELTTVARALDRVLCWEHYVVPHWYLSSFRLAYWNKFEQPKIAPKYNPGLFTWWVKEKP